MRAPLAVAAGLAALGASLVAVLASARASDVVTLSIVATTDLHGAVFPRERRGGLALLAGYVSNLRAARAADGGAVLLLDAGDTYQGGIESNLSEGALVVDAYNAMGYAAAAVGNHEFDFGPVDVDGRRRSGLDDPRGALKAIAARARFPLLAANLIDESSGQPVTWPNVRPSVIVEAAGVRVGIVGVMTLQALQKTLVVNTRGLRVTPLAPAIVAETTKLRAAGATVVVVVAHAGGSCARFDQPDDLSSCDGSAEIFQVAHALPRGLVDAIVAGHAHGGLAHTVNGIPITESFSRGRAFGRIDLAIDRNGGQLRRATVFAPRELVVPADYEGRTVTPDAAVMEAMAPELRRVRDLQATLLGASVDAPLRRAGDAESPLGNLFADALRASVPGADVAINNAYAGGGLRADLPAGPLTLGRLYDVFPFDNQVAALTLTGEELSRVIRSALARRRRGVLGVSGIRVRAECAGGRLQLAVVRDSGRPIGAAERLVVVTTEMLASGSLFAPAARRGGVTVSPEAPIAREVVADWIRSRGGRLSESQFAAPAKPRWDAPVATADCAAS